MGGVGARPTKDPCVRRGTLREMRGAWCPRVVGSFRSEAGGAAERGSPPVYTDTDTAYGWQFCLII